MRERNYELRGAHRKNSAKIHARPTNTVSSEKDDAKENLLFLSQRIPYPPNKGEKIRYFHTLAHLNRSYNVYLGCLIDDEFDWNYVENIAPLCVDSHFAKLNRRGAKIRCLRGLITGEPLSVTFYRDRGLAAWVSHVLRDVRPDVVFVCSSNMASYVLDQRGQERVRLVDMTDVDSEKWRTYAEHGSFPMTWVHAREWRRIAKLESRIVRECDWSTFVSCEEAALFTGLQPDQASKIRAVSNGVDHNYFDPMLTFDRPFAGDGLHFIFTGTMDYPPNIDAVIWFTHTILPIIQHSRPKAQFHIVGSSPTPDVMALASVTGVSVTGRVPDVRPYLAHGTAGVAPMRIARGIQNKVLEAMAMAKPVIVTADGLEGIEAVPGTEVLVATTSEAFAEACLRAATPDGASIGQAARKRVMLDYLWADRLRGFDALLSATPLV